MLKHRLQTVSKWVHVSAVETMIRDRYDRKDDAKKYAAGYLLEQLQGSLGDVIKDASEELKQEIDKFLDTYEESLKLPKFRDGSKHIPFNPTGAFVGGIAGLGVVGALATWAAGLGNLGAYILVAKAVSLLSALGISISGGVATAVSFVALIGGPIVLAIGLVAIAALIGSFFQGPWQHRLAKKIVEHFEKEKVLNKFLEGIDTYWQDTANAFDKGADAVEVEFQVYIAHLQELCADDAQSKEKVEDILLFLSARMDFFVRMPWENTCGCS